jgi:NTE family protein
MATPRRKTRTPVDLALQGGGSHGAFTWGVLDALLEDGSLDIDGVSGASAGAMNAAVLACGFARDGRDGARRALAAFWRDIGECRQAFAPAARGTLAGFNLGDNPWWAWWNAWLAQSSPYQWNPGNANPLREVVERHVDVPLLRGGPLRVFVTATSVRTGQAKLFSGNALDHDALMASACLPQLFQAVMIGGQAYWDGGYTGNPALWPLIYNTRALDVVLVQIDPLVRETVPKTAADIADRLNEITFNAGLAAEMRAIAFVQELVQRNGLKLPGYKAMRMHRIADDEALAPLDLSSKTNNDGALLELLFTVGRAAAQRWLAKDRPLVGKRSSFDIDRVFLEPRG